PSNSSGPSQWSSWDQPAGGHPPQQQQPNGVAIAALVCGIVALLLSWIPLINLLAVVLGIAAIVTGALGIRRANLPGYGQKGLAVGGLVTGGIAFLLSVVILIGLVGLFADPEFREPLDRLLEGEDPEDVLDDLERRIEEQQR
ncbi:MAG TPA: hypothetical protein VM287_09315, partial [Egibacteraceae bacterium]|nr:hypothetical protein [Egibacteraceae bacterium]